MSNFTPLTRAQTQAEIELTCYIGFNHLWLSPQLMEAMDTLPSNLVRLFACPESIALRAGNPLKDRFSAIKECALTIRPHTDGGLIVCNLVAAAGAATGWRTVVREEDDEHGVLFTFPLAIEEE